MSEEFGPARLSVARYDDANLPIALLEGGDSTRPTFEIGLARVAHRGRRCRADKTTASENPRLAEPDGRVVGGMARAGKEELPRDAQTVEREGRRDAVFNRWPTVLRRQLDGLSQRVGRYSLALHLGQPA
jgi:hypothetical protein